MLFLSCVESTSDFQHKCRTLDFVSVWVATVFIVLFIVLKNTSLPPPYLNSRRLALAQTRLKFCSSVTGSVRNDLCDFLRECE